METRIAAPRRRLVVIVDDHAALGRFFSEILKLHGYETLLFSDARAALRYVLAHEPDVILCDLQMPHLDGDLFYATVERSNPGLAQRFVFVTGGASEKQFQHFLATVRAPVLVKPVPVEALLAEVDRASR